MAGLEIERKKVRKKMAHALLPGSYAPLKKAQRGGYHNVPRGLLLRQFFTSPLNT